MLRAYDPATAVFPSDDATRGIGSTLLFRRSTIWIVYFGAGAIAVGLFLWSMLNHSALLTPVSPNFRALMIGFGVFLGVLVAEVEREAWALGAGGRRAPHGAVATGIAMVALVVASGFGGDFVARQMWEWRAFHGLQAAGADHIFTVVSRYSGRSGASLELRDREQGRSITINCSRVIYTATQIGDRLLLPVETGRGGVQRVTLPPLRSLRRA